MSKFPEDSGMVRFLVENGLEFIEIYVCDRKVQRIISSYTGELDREHMSIKNSIRIAFEKFAKNNPKEFLEVYNMIEHDNNDSCFSIMRDILHTKKKNQRFIIETV